MKRRVVLVDDHELFRAGVRGEIATSVDIVGEAGTVAEAVPLIDETLDAPDRAHHHDHHERHGAQLRQQGEPHHASSRGLSGGRSLRRERVGTMRFVKRA